MCKPSRRSWSPQQDVTLCQPMLQIYPTSAGFPPSPPLSDHSQGSCLELVSPLASFSGQIMSSGSRLLLTFRIPASFEDGTIGLHKGFPPLTKPGVSVSPGGAERAASAPCHGLWYLSKEVWATSFQGLWAGFKRLPKRVLPTHT